MTTPTFPKKRTNTKTSRFIARIWSKQSKLQQNSPENQQTKKKHHDFPKKEQCTKPFKILEKHSTNKATATPENQQTKENHQDFPKKNKNHFNIISRRTKNHNKFWEFTNAFDGSVNFYFFEFCLLVGVDVLNLGKHWENIWSFCLERICKVSV